MPRDDVSIQMELDLLKYQSNHVFLDIIPTTAGTPSRPRARVTPPAAVAVSSSDLFGHHYSLMAVEEESKNECDEEKMVFMMAKAQEALSMAQFLLMLIAHEEPLLRP